MTTRERLHVIVDRLPEEELIAVERMLATLDLQAGPRQALANAPLDDEPDDDDFDGGLTRARNQNQSGQTISSEELLHRLGIEE